MCSYFEDSQYQIGDQAIWKNIKFIGTMFSLFSKPNILAHKLRSFSREINAYC